MIPLDTPLKGLPLAVIDFEATTFAGPDAHVVEAAVVHATFGSDAVHVAYTSRVRPPVPIPASATQVHGITDADVAAAPTWREMAPGLLAACAGRLPVAFMAPADFTYLATENERLGLPPLPWPWLCLFVVRRATKTRGRPGKLGEIAEEHGIVLDAHGATGDALSTALLVRPMLRAAWRANAFRGPEGAQPPPRRGWRSDEDEDEDRAVPNACPRTVGELLDWQRGAALHQEREWARYRREQGDILPPRSDFHRLYGVDPPTWEAHKRTRACPTCSTPTVMRVGQGGGVETVDAMDGQPHVCPSQMAGHR